ncbi:hypothetical protein KOW79_006327 [Hemibagrus wyckioides]|uniref:Uncharacterized protein n=1 Tax=Hemibagrus wyckioides TaxID=337641 RepID=A0A9D3NZJ2_9TELE|nr:hypothetical protein KOW79_006327 [Hemibagrus wyckioides]
MATRVTFLIFCCFLCLSEIKSPAANETENQQEKGGTGEIKSPAANETENQQEKVGTGEIKSPAANETENQQEKGGTGVIKSPAANETENQQEKGGTETQSRTSVTPVQLPTNTTQSPDPTTKIDDKQPNPTTTLDKLKTNSKGAEQGQQSENTPKKFDARYLWLLVLVVAVLAVVTYFKCFKRQTLPVETMDHGTENASFQRTESKDGVMLLGVKSGGEENAAAK